MKIVKKQFSQAFTIIEILVVVVVIAILASITIVSYNGITKQAEESALKVNLRGAATKLVLSGTPAANLDEAEIESDSNTQYEYTRSGSNYCLTAFSLRNTELAFHIDQGGSIQPGACSGHSVSGPSHPDTQNPDTAAACFTYSNSSTYDGLDASYYYQDTKVAIHPTLHALGISAYLAA